MDRFIRRLTFAAMLASGQILAAQAARPQTGLPHLEKRGSATQLVVDGQPFLMLGGELHNSSSSSLDYMKPIWPRMAGMHLNTVLTPVAWETIEPEEGRFDFKVLDGLLEGARENKLRLVLLWFGAWKNTYSSYVPAWVKNDQARFPRVQGSDGRGTERLSPLGTKARDADAHAFAMLMRHLREVDGARHTVLMVQVENEVGVIPDSRDYSAAANEAFSGQVPPALMKYLEAHEATLNPELHAAMVAAGSKRAGTWQEVFGKAPLTNDLFMAWWYASYIEAVAKAGKAEYPLPMYVNAALIRPNYLPGQYNSGGPLPQSMDLWKAAAPSLDMLSPDIYFNEFALWSGLYRRADNPLFVPETQGGATGAANALFSFGRMAAIGFSPFGIDGRAAPIDVVGVTNPAARVDNRAIGDLYNILSQLAPTILQKQSSGEIAAAVLEGAAQRSGRVEVGDYVASISRSGGPSEADARVGVLFLQTGANEFVVVGSGNAEIRFSTERPGAPIVGVESIDEEFVRDGTRVPGRRLNGDQTSQGQALRISTGDLSEGKIYRVRLYRYR